MATNNALQNTFRTDFAESLMEEFSVNSNDQYFIFFGKVDGWTVDTSPDTLVDSTESNYSSIRNSYGIKRIDRTNLFHIVDRYDWISGAVYAQYDDTTDMSDKQFYTMTDEYNLYKCIENGSGSKSTSKPTHTEPEIKASGDDGYKWKFLGKVSETARTFLTREYIPIEYVTNADEDENATQLASQRSSIDGSIDRIVVSTQSSNLPYVASTPLGKTEQIKYKIYGSSDDDVIAGTAVAGTTIAINASVITGIDPQDDLIGMDVLTVAGEGPDVGQLRRITGFTAAGAGGYSGPNGEDFFNESAFVSVNTPFSRTLGASTQTPTRFRILPPVNIFGDGINATLRTEVDDNLKISSVIPISRGKEYTKAWIEFPGDEDGGLLPRGFNSGVSGQIPTARAIISPRGGHGSNPIKELQSSKVMIVLSVNRDEQQKLRTANQYRQFGIIKNPNLNSLRYGITAGIAGKEYKRQTKLNISKPNGIVTPYSYGENGTYIKDNYIIGEESFGTARILDWIPNVGATANGSLIVESIQGDLIQGSLVDTYVRYVFGASFGNATDAGGLVGGDFIVGATATQDSVRTWGEGYPPAGITNVKGEGIVESWDPVHRELVIKVTKESFTDSVTADYVRQYQYDGNDETTGVSAAYWSWNESDSSFGLKGGELFKQFTIQSTAEGIHGGTSGFVTLTESTGEGVPTQTYHSYGRLMGISPAEIDENLNPVYTTATRLLISSTDGTSPVPSINDGRFAQDAGITQDFISATGIPNATGKVLDYVLRGSEGATQADAYITDVVGTFFTGQMTINENEGWEITEVEHSEIDLTSGEVLYIQNIRPISRSIEQDEEYKIVIGF